MAKAISPSSSSVGVANSYDIDVGLDGSTRPNDDRDVDDSESYPSVKSKSSNKSHSPNHVQKKSPKREDYTEETTGGQMLNGFATVQVDRYGFVGGKEFTDPEQ